MQRRLIASVLALSALAAACASDKKVPVKTAARVSPVCVDFSFPIYFETNSERLTAAAAQVVTDAAVRVKGCTLGKVDVVGLADADGSDRRNMVLSRQRATIVADALAKAGLPRPAFDIDAAGASGAITPEGQPEPLRRRTEVVIRASSPAPAAKPAPTAREPKP